MTTGKVAQLVSMLKNPELMGMPRQSQEAELAFGAFLSQTAKDGGQELISAEGLGQKASGNDTVNQTAYEKEAARTGYRDSSISRNEPADISSRLPKDAQDKVQAFDQKVKEVIAGKLGISEEEVTQQMEAMGLTALDLMVPSKLASLVMQLTGSDDIGGLLFCEDFQQMLSQIGDLTQELAAQLNLTSEEMVQVQTQLESLMSDNPQSEDPQGVHSQNAAAATENLPNPGETSAQVDAQNVQTRQAGDPAAVQNDSAKAQAKNIDPVKADIPEEPVKGAVQQEETPSLQETAQMQENQDGQEEPGSGEEPGGKPSELFKENDTGDKAQNRQTHVTYQTTAQNIGQGQTVEVTQTVVQTTRVDMENILRQVSQMTRVFVSQAESSIEMQLNPANLGKIYLQVVSREGVITAQIAAQNEAVKEALESQAVVLKENMNQQGLKVEAIEVTIASHEFERNLEENQQNAARQQQEEEAAGTARRNLNLNSLEEMEGAMTEEESLAARIMSEQGNSMDVTA